MSSTDPLSCTISFGPRVRKSPFFDSTIEAGAAAFTVYNHMYMATSYGNPLDEYWAIVNGVTLWDVSCERQVEIIGPDAVEFLQRLTPRDISHCPVGRCRYVLLTDHEGGIVNDAVLLRLDAQRFWLSPGDGDVLLWVQGIAAQASLNVSVTEPDVSPLQLQGPLAPKVARKLFGEMAVTMGYYHLCETTLEDIPVVLSRTGWSGELGYEIYLRDGSRGRELWERVMEAGREYGIKPACPSLVRSLEGGILSYCSDLTRDDTPFTIGFERLMDLDKPYDFIGKAALKKIALEGPPRRLVGVELTGSPLPGNDRFWNVHDETRRVGHLTRCCWSPRLEKNIGLVNVPTSLAEIGTKLRVDTCEGERDAEVVRMPWITSVTQMPADI